MIAAPQIIQALVMAKQGSDMSTSGIGQRITLDAFASHAFLKPTDHLARRATANDRHDL